MAHNSACMCSGAQVLLLFCYFPFLSRECHDLNIFVSLVLTYGSVVVRGRGWTLLVVCSWAADYFVAQLEKKNVRGIQ